MQFINLCAQETHLGLETATMPVLTPPNVDAMLILYHSTFSIKTLCISKLKRLRLETDDFKTVSKLATTSEKAQSYFDKRYSP